MADDPDGRTSAHANGGGAPQDQLAHGLGVFSFVLGVPQVLAPGRVNRLIGVRDDARSRMWMRAVGVREIAAGVGILSRRRPAICHGPWTLVAGDTMDLALLGSALRAKSDNSGRTVAATGAVIGAFAADLFEGVRLARSNNGGAESPQDNDQEAKPMHVRRAITVRRGRAELYARWREFERFPEFMAHVEEVSSIGPNRWHWKATGPLGMTVGWDAEITEDVPGERIAWTSLEGSRVQNSGSVTFTDAPADQGTEIHLELHYDVPGGTLGATVAKLFGEEPAIQVKDDLRRFKQIVETGEIVRSDGSPEGPLSRRQLKQRPAHPPTEDEVAATTPAGGTS